MFASHRITSPQSPVYPLAERLLTSSFPREEYRDLEEWRRCITACPHFHLMLNREAPALLTYWDFPECIYVEHLAVDASARRQGYGGRMLQALKEEGRPIVLEVELPETDIARRRIAFYERNGFRLWTSRNYQQPPYRQGDAPIAMRLMAWGNLPESRFEEVVRRIYREVYHSPN